MHSFNAHNIDTEDFWNKKIRTWEVGRYDKGGNEGFLERIANRSSDSLRNRLRITAALLRPHLKDKKIVEIGCGSALMAQWFLENGAQHYTGFDIARSAIDNAEKLFENSPYRAQMIFEQKPVLEMEDSTDGDVFFSLGVLDWLTDEELKKIFAVSGSKDYLHAISEKQFSVSQFFHQTYVHLAYGFKTQAYVPRYFKPEEIEIMASPYNSKKMNVYRDSRLSFGALLTSLDVEAHADLKDIPAFKSSVS